MGESSSHCDPISSQYLHVRLRLVLTDDVCSSGTSKNSGTQSIKLKLRQ
jgi:hypothetical protein